MTKQELKKAKLIGYEAAKNDGECIPAFNKQLLEMISGLEVGAGATEIIASFNSGVYEGLEL